MNQLICSQCGAAATRLEGAGSGAFFRTCSCTDMFAWRTKPAPDPVFDAWMEYLRERVVKISSREAIFTTDATWLFEDYVNYFAANRRQHHNCTACRQFLEAYGGLVVIDEDGNTVSLLWDENKAPPEYHASVKRLRFLAESAKVTGVFYSDHDVLGRPTSGGWSHLHTTLAAESKSLCKDKVKTAYQAAADKDADRVNVIRATHEHPRRVLEQAVKLLESETLDRAEKLRAGAEWLLDLQMVREKTKDARRRDNITWRRVALAPAGFCHPRSGMLGTLLDDVAQGFPHETIRRRLGMKMNPLVYQRPQAPPAAGAIEQAEKLFEQLGLAPALRRRFAYLDEIEAIWKPRASYADAQRPGTIFGHLAPKGFLESQVQLPSRTMTWEKFQRTILPTARKIECYVPSNGPYIALTAAADPNAPPILQWDRPDRRNTVAWYVWLYGAPAEQFSLRSNTWVEVKMISHLPPQWSGQSMEHFGESAVLYLDGCKDTREPSLALFPEFLRSELHGVRSVIEAHSRQATLEPAWRARDVIAAGLRIQKNDKRPTLARLRVDGNVVEIDRWD